MQKQNKLELLLKEYFESNKLMQLATVSKKGPWLCNVYYVTDASNNIYWTSAKGRRHSVEILSNPVSACTIVHSEDKKQALQIAGNAYEVPLADVARVNKLYADKFGDKPTRLAEALENTSEGRAYWVLKPNSISFWDEVNFPEAPKQEYL